MYNDGLQTLHFLNMVWMWPCSFNVRCTTNCETPTSAASRRVMVWRSASTCSKICSSASYYGHDREFEARRDHYLGDAVPLMQMFAHTDCAIWKAFDPQFAAINVNTLRFGKIHHVKYYQTHQALVHDVSSFCPFLISAPFLWFLSLVGMCHSS